MYKPIISILAFLFLLACASESKKATAKFGDPWIDNMLGNLKSVQDSSFIIDSTGKIVPDSLVYGLSEWQDNYLMKYTDIDTGRNKVVSNYDHFENGLLKGIVSDKNGKSNFRLEVQLDSNGRYTTAQSYDSTNKMDYYNLGLSQDDSGRLTGGKLYKADSSLQNSFVQRFEKKYYASSETYDSVGKISAKNWVKRDEKDNIIIDSTLNYVKDSTTTVVKVYRYDSYDDKGNWSKRTELNQARKPVKEVRRKIVYID